MTPKIPTFDDVVNQVLNADAKGPQASQASQASQTNQAGQPEKAVTRERNIFDDGLIWQESRGQQFGKDNLPLTSKAGAIGVAQVMPGTAPLAARLAGLEFDEKRYRTDPSYNLELGRAYFNQQLQTFGDESKALAAYNAGPGAVRNATRKAELVGDPDNWLRFLPKETQAYVPSVMNRFYGTDLSQQASAPYYAGTGLNLVGAPDPVKPPTAGDYGKQALASTLGALGSLPQAVGAVGAMGLNAITGTQDYEGKNLLDDSGLALGKSLRESMSEGGKAALNDGVKGNILKGEIEMPDTSGGLAMAGIGALGSLAGSILPALFTGGASLAAELNVVRQGLTAAKAAGDAAKVAELTAKASSLTRKAAVMGGATNALSTAGDAYSDAMEQAQKAMAKMTHEQMLEKIPVYADAFAQYGDERQARNAVENKAGEIAGLLSAGPGAAAGGLAGKAIGDIVTKQGLSALLGKASGSTLGRTAIGGLGVGLAGGAEETLEKMGTNAGANIALGKDALDDIGRDTAGEAFGGFIGGGAIGSVAGLTAPKPNPVADQAAKPGSVLSRAAIATNPDLAPPDAFTQRAGEVEAAVREGGLLDQLRDIGQAGRTVPEFLDALNVAKNTQARPQDRQQAVDSLNMAMDWLAQGKMPNTGAMPSSADSATESPAANPPGSALTVPAGGDLTSPGVAPVWDPNVVNADAVRVDNMLGGPRALAGPNAEAPSAVPPAPPPGSPPAAPSTPPAPTEGVANTEQTPSNEGVSVSEPATQGGSATVAEPVLAARKKVSAPRVAIPAASTANRGSAQIRKRKAQLGALVGQGFDTVEKRDDGFFLVSLQGNAELALDGPLDAQLARKAVSDYVQSKADTAAASPNNTLKNPTPEQIKAGNYKKSDVIGINGVKVVLENPKGSVRSGVSPQGVAWQTQMAHHYGEIRGVIGADGDKLDVFIGDRPDSGKIFVVDQINKNGSFDEHKVIFGARDAQDARATYLANYEKGWSGLGAITEMTPQSFKAWTTSPAVVKPAADYDGLTTPGANNDGRGTAATQGPAGAVAGVDSGAPDSGVGAGLAADAGTGLRDDALPGAGPAQRVERDAAADASAVASLARKESRTQIRLADPQAPATQALDRLLDVFAGLTGKRGIAIDDKDRGAFDGAAYEDNFFVNVDRPQQHVASTIAHEYKHLTERFPEIEKLYSKMWGLVPQLARQAYFETYLYAEKRDAQGRVVEAAVPFEKATAAQQEKLKDEMMADFMGQRFRDRAWLAQLARERPALFGNFVREWIQALDALIGSLKRLMGVKQDGSGLAEKDIDALMQGYLDELKEAKAIAMDVAAAWVQQNPGLAKRAGVDAQVQNSARQDAAWAQQDRDAALAQEKPAEQAQPLANSARVTEEPAANSARRAAEREYAAVEAQYRGTNQWMKAPNGAQSRLNERQWVQVRTPSFQQWFGPWMDFAGDGRTVWSDDQGQVSKVVDENGEPLVVYHGSPKGGFMAFERPSGKGRGDLGIFTAVDEGMAESYVRRNRARRIVEPQNSDGPQAGDQPGVYALFVNIRNPSESDFEGANWDGAREGQFVLFDENGDQLYAEDGRAYFVDEERDIELARLAAQGILARAEQAPEHYESTDSVVRQARRYNNDGAIIRQVRDDGGGTGYSGDPSDVFVAFEPNQLKSADFNNGDFGDVDDMRYSRRSATFTDPAQRLEVSTAQPTAKRDRKTGYQPSSYTENRVIDFEDVKASKKHLDQIVAALRKYNTLSGRGDANQVLQELRDLVKENLLWLHDHVKPEASRRARLWYDGANRIANDWTSKFGLNLRQAGGILAVFSPQMDWFKNVSLAERAITILNQHGNETWSEGMTRWAESWLNASTTVATKTSRLADVKAMRAIAASGKTLSEMNAEEAAYFVRAFDEAYYPRSYRLITPEGGFGDFVEKGTEQEEEVESEEVVDADAVTASITWGGFGTIEKAVKIYRDNSFRTVDTELGGEHKVRNFYNNIVLPGSADGHVTIDTHAVAAALMKALSGASEEVMHNLGGLGSTASTGASGSYALFADAYRDAAAERFILAREMQSITWEAIRSLFPAKYKKGLSGKVSAVWDRVRAGELTREAARQEILTMARAVGGDKPFAWEGKGEGDFAKDGATSFDPVVAADPAAREVRTMEKKDAKDKISVALSAATRGIPGVANLYLKAQRGDKYAHALLQDMAADNLAHLLAGTSAKLSASPSTGLYGGSVEPSLNVQITFTDEDRPVVLAALAKFADNFAQEQVHVLQPTKDKLGTAYDDGSYVTPVYRWELTKALKTPAVQRIIDKSGLAGLTVGDDFVEAYYVGEPKNEQAIKQFQQGAGIVDASLGKNGSGVGRTAARLWPYGDGDGTIGYERIRGEIPAGPATSSKTARRVAEYLNQVDGKPGRVKTFEQEDQLTPEQDRKQSEIADLYASLPDNDLKNPRVRKAYAELAKEVLRQYAALPVKVELMIGAGEPYKNSGAMRRDILDNNHLSVFATTPDTFGPPGVSFAGHPLLESSGLNDQNGQPMLFNDLFRAVHDYYAHAMTPVQFGPLGEEAAWKNHMSMTRSPWARWALTIETRGQNSYVNFNRGLDRTIPISQREFAPQKAALLPIAYSLTGNANVDRMMKEFIKALPEAQRQGTKPKPPAPVYADEVGASQAKGSKVAYEIQITDTQELAKISIDAGTAIEDYNRRIEAMQKLIGCLRK